MSSHDTLVFLEVHLYLYQMGLQILLVLALPEVPVVPEAHEILALPEVPEVPESLTLPEVPESLTLPEVPEVPVLPVVPVVPEVPVVPVVLLEQAVAGLVVTYRPTLLPEQSPASHCRIPWCRKVTRQMQSLALLDLVQGP